MKFVAKTRWEYYAANVAGIIAVLGLLAWCIARIFANGKVDLTSIYLWLSLVLLVALIFALISFLSSMKSVEVNATGLVISYVFQKHRNIIQFSEVARLKSNGTGHKASKRQSSFRDTFQLILSDGRVFEFDRAQLDQYGKLKAACLKRVKG